jgi:uncharacterized RmlC-like cupin family protein
MIAKPHTASAVHHHGEQDTVVFSFSGYGTVVSEGGNKRQNLSPGDFALIPYVLQRLEKKHAPVADCFVYMQGICRASRG